MSLSEKLSNIQRKIKCNKTQYNKFGNYNYRSCEDILEAVKPLLDGCSLVLRDEVKEIGNIIYVESTAVLGDEKEEIKVSAQAGIDPSRKGMDIAQSFGSSSSYARKYALSGLLLLDDTKDADSTNTHGKEEKAVTYTNTPLQVISGYVEDVVQLDKAEGGDTEAMKLEMAQWCNVPGNHEKFEAITGGHFKNPLDIKTAKNVELAYKRWKKSLINS